MAAKKSGLGKGLDSLISKDVNTEQLNRGLAPEKADGESVIRVKISKVEPNREQPRKNFDEAGLAELADSIKQHGILQPLIVQDAGKYYEIVAGERRWRAAKLAGIKEVPVIVRDFTGPQQMEISLIENIQREDLNPIEEAQAYQSLLTEFGLKQDEVAARVSKNRTTVANSLRLLKLSDEVQQMVIDGRISSGHARCLVPINDQTIQLQLAKRIAEQNLSVRETEQLVRAIQNKSSKTKRKKAAADERLDAIYADLEKQMRQTLGTKVSIRRTTAEAGRIEIAYYSQEDLDRILQLIRGAEQA